MKRVPTIVGAYLASSFAAGLTAALAVVLAQFIMWLLAGAPPDSPTSPPPSYSVIAVAITIFGSTHAAGFALIPAAVVIVIAETRRLRLPSYYAACGVAAAVVPWCILNYQTLLTQPALMLMMTHLPFLVILCAAGLVAGLVYWHLAGRTAGWAQNDVTPQL